MIRDDAVTRIRRGLGYDTRLSANIIIDALGDAQDALETRAELPWFLQTELSSINTIVDEERLKLPVDFLLEVEDEHLYIFDSTLDQPWTPLCKDDADELRPKYSAPARPVFYTITDEYFRLFPTPDAIYTMKMVYYQKALVLDSNIENKWLKFAPLVMIGLAGRFLAAQRFNDRAKAEFTELLTFAEKALSETMEARKHTQRRYQMGGSE
jgi:hypothetical protein